MLEAVQKVKSALDTKDLASHLTHYAVRDGTIFSSNGRMVAAAPFPHDGEFIVPGAIFEKTLSRMPEGVALVVEENRIVLKAGRFRGAIETLDAEVEPYDPPPKKLSKLPDKFLEKLTALRPFVSENALHPWSMAVYLNGKNAFASSNVVLAVTTLKSPHKGLLPGWAVDYILSRDEQLTGWHGDENRMFFVWEDRSWIKTQLFAGTFPETAFTLLKKMPKAQHEISDEWREAYALVAGLSENSVKLYEDKITGGGNHLDVEARIESALPDGAECSIWNPIYLTPALDAATHWSPEQWPKPASFKGALVKGLVIGRTS